MVPVSAGILADQGELCVLTHAGDNRIACSRALAEIDVVGVDIAGGCGGRRSIVVLFLLLFFVGGQVIPEHPSCGAVRELDIIPAVGRRGADKGEFGVLTQTFDNGVTCAGAGAEVDVIVADIARRAGACGGTGGILCPADIVLVNIAGLAGTLLCDLVPVGIIGFRTFKRHLCVLAQTGNDTVASSRAGAQINVIVRNIAFHAGGMSNIRNDHGKYRADQQHGKYDTYDSDNELAFHKLHLPAFWIYRNSLNILPRIFLT